VASSPPRSRARELDLSPSEVARAIGVSESSVKRWVDRGVIPSRKTAGGHRRLPAVGVVRFLRKNGYRPAAPEILGLPRALAAPVEADRARAVLDLVRGLAAGQEAAVRGAVLGPYLAGAPLAEIFDQVLAPAFHQIGHDWENDLLEVYREHRAVEIAMRHLHELRELMPEPAQRAPLAIGATLEGDPYTLPLHMAGLVLMENGWRAEPLGPNLPASTLRAALGDLSPRLVWINVSYVSDRARLIDTWAELYDAARARGIALVAGGQALDLELRSSLRYTAFCGSMNELVGLSETLAQRR
jgi:excisionase family DNA binding protein